MTGAVRRTLPALIGLVAIAGAVAWLSGAFESRVPPGTVTAEGTPLPPDTREAVAERLDEVAFETASGTVAAARRTSVAARVLARIKEVKVRAGSEVAKGDVVVVLDGRDYEARVRQIRDSQRGAAARLDLARTEKDRIQALFEKGVATRQRLDETISALQVAEAERDRLSQSLDEARTALSHTVIRSPVAGRVVDRLAEPGDMAAPGQTLVRIYDPTVLRVEVPVRESLAVRLGLDQRLGVEVPALEESVEGIIDEIVPLAEPGARTLLVKVRLPYDPRLLAGMYARVRIPAGMRARILIPAAAITRVGQLKFVTVVTGEGRAERRLVTIGQPDGRGRIEVLSGIAAGERVAFQPPAADPAP